MVYMWVSRTMLPPLPFIFIPFKPEATSTFFQKVLCSKIDKSCLLFTYIRGETREKGEREVSDPALTQNYTISIKHP